MPKTHPSPSITEADVTDAMVDAAFYANHDPRGEPSSVERYKLRRALTAFLKARRQG